MYMDDDEWFEDVTEIIDFFNTGEYQGYGMAAYTQRNYLEKDGSVYTDLLVGRMTKLAPDTRFIYRIHEYFNHVRGRTKKFNAYVHHYGYVYASAKEARAHSMRNIRLLLEVLNKRMRVSREIGQYKKEHRMPVLQIGRHDEIMQSRAALAEEMGMSGDFMRTVLSAIHEESVRQQIEVLNDRTR